MMSRYRYKRINYKRDPALSKRNGRLFTKTLIKRKSNPVRKPIRLARYVWKWVTGDTTIFSLEVYARKSVVYNGRRKDRETLKTKLGNLTESTMLKARIVRSRFIYIWYVKYTTATWEGTLSDETFDTLEKYNGAIRRHARVLSRRSPLKMNRNMIYPKNAIIKYVVGAMNEEDLFLILLTI